MRRLIKAFFILLVLLGALLGVLVASIWNDAKLSLKDYLIKKPNDHSLGRVSFLEKGAPVDPLQLKIFQAFEKNQHESLSKEEKILPPLVDNDCSYFFCFQHRTTFTEIPVSFLKGLMAIEDDRFLNHPGVDYLSLLRAFWVDLKNLSLVQGGSTLTQQLAKNLFFRNEKTLKRKFKEIIYSFYIEKKMSKEQILNAYFNEMVWGSLQGVRIKGFYAASLFYFSQKPEDLNDYQIAVLISMLKGPYYYRPLKYPARLRKRANLVFSIFQQKKLLSFSSKIWSEDEWKSWLIQLKENEQLRYHRALWSLSKHQFSVLEPYEAYAFHLAADKVLRAIEKKTGEKNFSLKSIIIPFGCQENCEDLFSYYSRWERDQEKALSEERHQVGSILKPLVYAKIFEQKNRKDLVSTKKLILQLKSGSWSPRDAAFQQDFLSLEEALLRSKNGPTIRLAQEYGFERLETYLSTLLPQIKKPLKEFPAQLLGAIELSLTQVVSVYDTFLKGECTKPESAVLDILSHPSLSTVSSYLDPRLKKVSFFHKTGTSNKGLDNWFIGFDGKHIMAFWLGWEGVRKEVQFKLSGGSTSFKVFQEFLLTRGKRPREIFCPSAN